MNYWPAANMNYSAYAEYGDPSAALTAYRWLRMTFYKEKHVTQKRTGKNEPLPVKWTVK